MAKKVISGEIQTGLETVFPGLPRQVILAPNPKKRTSVTYEMGYESQDGRLLDKEKFEVEKLTRAPNTKYTLMAAISADKGGYLETGLTDLIANPYKDHSKLRSKEWEEVLLGHERVLRQHVVEYFWNKPIGYYTNQITVSRFPQRGEIPKFVFFQSDAAVLDLEDGANTLDLASELGMIRYFMALADPNIANSYEEITPETDYYIARRDEEETRKTKSVKVVDFAVDRLVDIAKEFPSRLADFCKVLEIEKKNLSSDAAYEILSNAIKNKRDFIPNFNYYYDLFKEESTREMFDARVFLADLVEHRIISKRSNVYTWYPPKDADGKQLEALEWERKEEVLDYLVNPKFRKEQAEMLEQVKSAKRFA